MHKYWMSRALVLARSAWEEGEVPIGAVLVQNNQVIGEGKNCPIRCSDPTAHAEIIAIRQGAIILQNYRMPDKTILYATLEPCLMCFGAMVHSRIDVLVYGAKNNKKNSFFKTFMNVFGSLYINHQIKVISGILEPECSNLLNTFFQIRRQQKKTMKNTSLSKTQFTNLK